MSFFPKSGRFKEQEQDESALGPGEYIAHKQYHVAQAMVPFGSMVERTGPVLQKEVIFDDMRLLRRKMNSGFMMKSTQSLRDRSQM